MTPHTSDPLCRANPAAVLWTTLILLAVAAPPASLAGSGTLTIAVDAVLDDPQDFVYTGDSGDFSPGFTLDDDPGDGTFPSSLTDIDITGTVTVVQTVPAGWVLTGLGCTGDVDMGSTLDTGTATAIIDVDLGEGVVCTFTNTKLNTIEIEKQTLPDGSLEVFSFTEDIDEEGFDLTDGQTQTFNGVADGTYDVSETVPAGWDVDISCVDPSGGTSTLGASATIDVAGGETVTCTFTNTQRGNIVIDKVTVPPGDPTSFEFERLFPMRGEGDAKGPSRGGTIFFLADADPPNDSGPLEPGSYEVIETVPAGWDLTDITCVDPSGGTETDPDSGGAFIDLAPGETVTCTYTNATLSDLGFSKAFLPDTIGPGSTTQLRFDISERRVGGPGDRYRVHRRVAGRDHHRDPVERLHRLRRRHPERPRRRRHHQPDRRPPGRRRGLQRHRQRGRHLDGDQYLGRPDLERRQQRRRGGDPHRRYRAAGVFQGLRPRARSPWAAPAPSPSPSTTPPTSSDVEYLQFDDFLPAGMVIATPANVAVDDIVFAP